jgi:hypothetical protein
MKTIKKIVAFAAIAILVFSCKKEVTPPVDNTVLPTTIETEGLTKVQDISNATHTIELYTKSGDFKIGHNALFMRLKNTATQAYESTANIAVKPMMHMTSMNHSCPVSDFTKTATKTSLYDGFVIFQMASNETEYWELTINYEIAGVNYTATKKVTVNNVEKRRVTTFTGTDAVKYVLALVNPSSPKVGINDMQTILYKMDNMTSFSPVNGYKVKIDPRMPSMGNHGSPNNVDLVQTDNVGTYNGKLSLTMTGYWKINLQVLDASNDVQKGEEITTSVTESSIFFEVEF